MSKIEVDAVEPQSGTTLTLGASGDTITIPAGATISNSGTAAGFGPTGAVSWDTTPKTANFTAVSGEGYFLDTTTTALTITLPATPSAGDIVSVADYDGTAATNAITVGRNSSNINGDAADFKISKNYAAISFVYVDATAGWRSVDTSNIENVQNPFIIATGGTITCDGDFKVHTFTGPGTFTVTNVGTPGGSTTVDYLVVAGGAGGGGDFGGGGGAGGFRQNFPSPSTTGLPVSAQGYPITVGSGGAGGAGTPGAVGTNGNPSIFSSITSTGGGGGGGLRDNGNPGGSGGGGGGLCGPKTGGTGNTPPVSPPQGFAGGNTAANPGPGSGSGGGGGSSAVGSNGTAPIASPGGAGTSSSISGSPTIYAGGGGGGAVSSMSPNAGGAGGPGGGGAGGSSPPGGQSGVAGTVNTGGGGGGQAGNAACAGNGAAGGSGIVIIRYKFQ